MSGARRHQYGLAVTRIEHDVIDYFAEAMRPVEAPSRTRRVAVIDERTFARADHQNHSPVVVARLGVFDDALRAVGVRLAFDFDVRRRFIFQRPVSVFDS